MLGGGVEQVGATVLGSLGQHLRRRQGGRFVSSWFAACIRVGAAHGGGEHGAKRANADVLASDASNAPCRAWTVLIKGSEGALRGRDVGASDRLLQGA